MKLILCIVLFPIVMIPVSHPIYAEQNFGSAEDVLQIDVNKQIQIAADVTNNQDIKQPFVYIVQVLDNEGKVVMLNWITGTLQPHQSISPAQSWIPTVRGMYTAQIFDWQCLDNCYALSNPLTMKITVT